MELQRRTAELYMRHAFGQMLDVADRLGDERVNDRPLGTAEAAALPTAGAGAGACDSGGGGFADRCRKAGACDGAKRGDRLAKWRQRGEVPACEGQQAIHLPVVRQLLNGTRASGGAETLSERVVAEQPL
jgi:hypothetical protein